MFHVNLATRAWWSWMKIKFRTPELFDWSTITITLGPSRSYCDVTWNYWNKNLLASTVYNYDFVIWEMHLIVVLSRLLIACNASRTCFSIKIRIDTIYEYIFSIYHMCSWKLQFKFIIYSVLLTHYLYNKCHIVVFLCQMGLWYWFNMSYDGMSYNIDT